MNVKRGMLLAVLVAALSVSTAQPQETPLIDKEALIDQFLAVDARQRAQIEDLTFDAEYYEGKMSDGEFEPEARYIKRVYIKFEDDTALYREEYREYYKEGVLQTPEELEKKAKERIEKARKRGTRNVSYRMLRPFMPEYREDYEITYDGLEEIEDTTCYHFQVVALEETDEHINGDYYFETDGFHLVRVDFSPAKLVKKTMFKLNQLDMSIVYGPALEGFWLPEEFDVVGKGKAALLFGVSFAGMEYYRNPQINTGLPEAMFKAEEAEDGE